MIILPRFNCFYFLRCVFPYSQLVVFRFAFRKPSYWIYWLAFFMISFSPSSGYKTRRPAVKTNPLASKTGMVRWGWHNVTTRMSFGCCFYVCVEKLQSSAQNQHFRSHNTYRDLPNSNWARQHAVSKRVYWHFPIVTYCKYNPRFTVNQPVSECPGFNFGLMIQHSEAVCDPHSLIFNSTKLVPSRRVLKYHN
jgi:hypothetical protein